MRINVVGVGSIGSFLALLLAKLKRYVIDVYDNDRVAKHNQRNQLYRKKDIKRFKVLALKDIIYAICGAKLNAHTVKVDARAKMRGAVVVAVDSMKSRKEIFAACRYGTGIPIYVDARSGGDGAVIYALDPRDVDQVRRYEKTLYDDESAVPAPCANEETLPILFTIASAVAKTMINAELKSHLNFTTVILNFEDQTTVISEEEEDP